MDSSSDGFLMEDVQDVATDLRCLFCGHLIPHLPDRLTSKTIDSIPIILNFHPANILNWNQRLFQASLCSSCFQITQEGSKLITKLAEIQQQITSISTSISNIIRKGYFGHATAQYTPGASTCTVEENHVTRLRHDLVCCLKLEAFSEAQEHDNFEQDTIQGQEFNEVFNLITVDDLSQEVSADEVDGSRDESRDDECLEDLDFVPVSFKPVRNNTKIFSEEELSLLVRLYKENGAVFGDKSNKNSDQRRIVWNTIALQVASLANNYRTGVQCRKKIERYNRDALVAADSVGGQAPVRANRTKTIEFPLEIENEEHGSSNVSSMSKDEDRESDTEVTTTHNRSGFEEPVNYLASSVANARDEESNNHIHDCDAPDLELEPRIEKVETVSIVPRFVDGVGDCTEYVVTTSNGTFILKHLRVLLTRYEPPPTVVRRRLNLVQKLIRRRQQNKLADSLKERKAPIMSLPCPYCPIIFISGKARAKHVRVTHPLEPPINAPLPCPRAGCDQNFRGIVSLERHIRGVHGGKFEYFCDIESCDFGFFTPKGIATHKSRYHDESIRKKVCDICQARFLNNPALSQHKASKHGNLKPFVCEVCSIGFKLHALLKYHQAKAHGSLDPVKFQPERLTCSTCGFISSSPTYLKRHKALHMDPSARSYFSYPCTIPNCNLRFDTPTLLKKHIISIHSEERNFQCHLCPTAYKDMQRLNYHLKRHDGIAEFKCPHCPKSLANSKGLSQHIKVIHEPIPRIKCEDCGEGFPIRKYYLRHRAICAQGFSGTAKKSTPKHVEARRRREGYI